jgi:hypothetical protein
VTEFQKRGTPHSHIIISTSPSLPFEGVDRVVSAEMPRDHPDPVVLARRRLLVQQFMTHRHSHRCQPNPGDLCSYSYPKNIEPATYMNGEGKITHRRRFEEDRWIVPHTVCLLEEFECHINTEICWGQNSFGYLFKYFWKRKKLFLEHDVYLAYFRVDSLTARIRIRQDNQEVIDEATEYITTRYMSATDAVNRIFRFHMSFMDPSVVTLPVHLKGRNVAAYNTQASNASLLIRWLKMRPRQLEEIGYEEYHRQYIVTGGPVKGGQVLREIDYRDVPVHNVKARVRGLRIPKLETVLPRQGEAYYLRCILQTGKTGRTWTDLRTIEMVRYDTYQAAAVAMGLFAIVGEADQALQEAIDFFRTRAQLRFLYVQLVIDGSFPALPLLETFEMQLNSDLIQEEDGEDERRRKLLISLQQLFAESGKTMEELGLQSVEIRSPRTEAEFAYWTLRLPQLNQILHRSIPLFTVDQTTVWDAVTQLNDVRPVFVSGKGMLYFFL